MRISPLAIAYRHDLEKLREFATEDARMTHSQEIVFDAVQIYTTAIALMINGSDKEATFNDVVKLAKTEVVKKHLEDAKSKPIPVRISRDQGKFTNGDEKCIGYLGVALQSAFYELLHAENFVSGLENAIGRGGDTDTNGCIVAALLGARFGVDEIPKAWIDTVRNAVPRNSLDFISTQDIDSLVPQLAASIQN